MPSVLVKPSLEGGVALVPEGEVEGARGPQLADDVGLSGGQGRQQRLVDPHPLAANLDPAGLAAAVAPDVPSTCTGWPPARPVRCIATAPFS